MQNPTEATPNEILHYPYPELYAKSLKSVLNGIGDCLALDLNEYIDALFGYLHLRTWSEQPWMIMCDLILAKLDFINMGHLEKFKELSSSDTIRYAKIQMSPMEYLFFRLFQLNTNGHINNDDVIVEILSSKTINPDVIRFAFLSYGEKQKISLITKIIQTGKLSENTLNECKDIIIPFATDGGLPELKSYLPITMIEEVLLFMKTSQPRFVLNDFCFNNPEFKDIHEVVNHIFIRKMRADKAVQKFMFFSHGAPELTQDCKSEILDTMKKLYEQDFVKPLYRIG